MTAFNIRTTTRARNALLAACAAITLGATAAHADIAKTGAAGYWSAWQGPNTQGSNSCMIMTVVPSLGETVAIVASAGDERLRVVAQKDSWNIPNSASAKLAFQVDNNPMWRTPESLVTDTNKILAPIGPAAARQFVHEITSGTTLSLYFTGTERPWVVSLSGTTGVWGQFMTCVQMVAPAVIASLNPTQPFVTEGPAQPYVPTPPKPVTQPFERSA